MEQDEYDEDRKQEFEIPELPNESFSELGGMIEDAVEGGEVSELADDDGGLPDGTVDGTLDAPAFSESPTTNAVAADTSGVETTATQKFDNSADERDRIDHPTRYSPLTGERAPPNHFYLPWNPPAAPAHGLPIDNTAAAVEADAAGPSPTFPTEPPRISRAITRPGQGSERVQLAIDTAASAPREDIGQPLPRVLVTVSLAAARNLFDDALEDATRQMAERFRKLALNEIERAAFLRRAAERAADYSLRGPVF